VTKTGSVFVLAVMFGAMFIGPARVFGQVVAGWLALCQNRSTNKIDPCAEKREQRQAARSPIPAVEIDGVRWCWHS
jgi:hypothetical protein